MSFFGFFRGRSRRVSSKGGDLLGFDLLYQLTYLSAVAEAGIPRHQIFQLGAKLPCRTAGYFAEVDRLAQTMNYQYAEACRLVSESAQEPEVRSLLLRLSGALSTGEPEAAFLKHEAEIQAEAYANDYERRLESLKKWTDAYVALMVSVALIVVVAAISTVIYDMGTGFVTGLVTVMVAISSLGAWVIYRTAPREVKTAVGLRPTGMQRVPRTLVFALLPSALVVGALLLSAGVFIGWVLAAVGVLLLPIGLTAWLFDGAVSKKDADISSFLRVLGSTASAIGTTPTEALGRMDLRSTGSLAPAVQRLHTMLRSRIRPELCWQRFAADTGSELTKRGVRVFLDGVSLGGEAEEVGARASLLTMQVHFMRAKRRLVSSSFTWLSLIMHAVLIFLLVFVIEIVSGFGTMVQSAGVLATASGHGMSMASAISFNFENMNFLRGLLIPVAVVLSVINAVTPKVADGGYAHKLFLYLGIALLTAGLNLAVAPRLALSIFNIAPTSL